MSKALYNALDFKEMWAFIECTWAMNMFLQAGNLSGVPSNCQINFQLIAPESDSMPLPKGGKFQPLGNFLRYQSSDGYLSKVS